MKRGLLAGVAAAGLLGAGIRLLHRQGQRLLHPDGRTYSGELRVPGGAGTGSALLDRPARHPVTVRVSKGIGTKPGRYDVLGLSVRVHGPVAGHRSDLLFSTCGAGKALRHIPALRRDFSTTYGSILAYRSGSGRKFYLAARPAPGSDDLGGTLESVTATAAKDGALFELRADEQTVAQLCFGQELPAATDAALAFNPIDNVTADLHPVGLIHHSRSLAYRLSQRWRGLDV
ncbi:hypothetical protein [Actinoplanes sp. RD1]|uniref:hypothetical protein n=1 Tax=Actinoplanes sp. RD1 TaxID=3064538 RepID=UPI0027424376|nr:hypothetical protein [Actinoplanes sp. RD1]